MTTGNKTMLIYNTDWYGRNSFRMMPITNDCPFNEVIYDPNTGVLAVISRDHKEKPQMLPKLNDKGMPIPLKLGSDAAQSRFVEERRMMDTYYEYYLDNKNDIRNFVLHFAINPEHVALSILNEESEKES
jgi:hypothetical protein